MDHHHISFILFLQKGITVTLNSIYIMQYMEKLLSHHQDDYKDYSIVYVITCRIHVHNSHPSVILFFLDLLVNFLVFVPDYFSIIDDRILLTIHSLRVSRN